MSASMYLFAALISIGIGVIALMFLRKQGPTLAVRRWSEVSSWIAMIFGLGFGLHVFSNPVPELTGWFGFDELQGLLVPYILLMGVLVERFAYNSLQTDPQYPRFFLKTKLLIACMLLFVTMNHSAPLALAWVLSGWVMSDLIAHSDNTAAIHSARMARHTFLLGDFLVLVGFTAMVLLSGSFYLTDWFSVLSHLSFSAGHIGASIETSVFVLLASAAISVGAFSKTAQIPFQQWLPQTPVAPTPVSGLMHAGFVNSGAILLAKLSPLVVQQPAIMTLLFVVGLASALWGSAAMLVQTDVKRYLTFSTIGQMGFMVVECGLGAFHLAILHLMVHGFFKARMFLSTGRVMEQRPAIRSVQAQQDLVAQQKDAPLLSSLRLAGAVGLSLLITGWLVWQTPIFQHTLVQLPSMLMVTLVLGTLFAQTILLKVKGATIKGLAVAILFSLSLVGLYVVYDRLGHYIFPDLNLLQHSAGLAIVGWGTVTMLVLGGLAWLWHLHLLPVPLWLQQRFYVYLLNASGSFPQSSTFSGRVTSLLVRPVP